MTLLFAGKKPSGSTGGAKPKAYPPDAARGWVGVDIKIQRRFCYLRMTDTNDDMSWAIRASPCHEHSKIDNRYYVLYNHLSESNTKHNPP